MLQDNISINVTENIDNVNIVASEVVEVVDLNLFPTTEDVTINVTEDIIQVNINKFDGSSVTKTSDLINDGEDGSNPFITLNDVSPYLADKVEFYGVIRYIQATSTWELLNDSTHKSKNINSVVSSSNSNGFSLGVISPNSNDYSIGTFIITPDESLSRSGISSGGSFAFGSVVCPVVQNQGFGFYMNGTSILNDTSKIVPDAFDVSFDNVALNMTMHFNGMNLTQGMGLGASEFNFSVIPSTNANFWFIRHDISYSTTGTKLKLKFYDLSGNVVTPTGRWYFNRTQPWQPLNSKLQNIGPNANFWVYGVYNKK